MSSLQPSLFGLKHSNRDFTNPYYWGKNQFNSSFPASLACYMRSKNICAVYLTLDSSGKIVHRDISFDDVFGTEMSNDELLFSFETRYEPYREFVHDEIETIDLVLLNNKTNQPIRPLEIKLTTLPDNTTEQKPESDYGCEIVVRSPTMMYLALSIGNSLKQHHGRIKRHLDNSCAKIQDWKNITEMKSKLRHILTDLNTLLLEFRDHEIPFLLQPVWKTIGKSPQLADNCLDIFVWSNFALTRLFMDPALQTDNGDITRHQRAALRLARFIYSMCGGKVYQKPIYDEMSYNLQTDKEFAVSGIGTNPYMKCERLLKPIIKKEEIKKIILGGGHRLLSPERRFDAILYFSTDLF
jgi:hypothetical protein